MPLRNIAGLDHVVVLVRDLDEASRSWQRLGFTLSPRGIHSAHIGSGNHTIMLDPDYIELLGILTPTERNAPSRDLLARRGEGLERTAFTAVDAAALVGEINTQGYPAIGPIDFERPVTLPDGREAAARFRIAEWPASQAPAGLRIFACQHLTRETVWIPELMRHPNTAQRIARVEIVSPDPRLDASHMAKLIGGTAEPENDGSITVASGGTRAPFIFMNHDGFAARYPGISLDGAPPSGAVGLVLVAADLAVAADAIGAVAVRQTNRVLVPPAAANGVVLSFIAG